MSTEITFTKSENDLIDAVDSCIVAREEKNHIKQALLLAKGIGQLKSVLSNAEVYKEIEQLMNKPFGFLTDKDPSKQVKNKKTGNWEYPKPYQKDVIIDCVAEALSLGLYLHNNEFNVIAGRCYPAQSGFKRKLSDVKRSQGIKTEIIPEFPVQKGGSFECACTVSWTIPEKEKESRVLKWNITAFSADAALGKVQKRASQWLYNELTGNNWTSSEDFWDVQENGSRKIKPSVNDIEAPVSSPITAEQAEYIRTGLTVTTWTEEDFLSHIKKSMNVDSIEEIPSDKFDSIKGWMQGEASKESQEA